MTEADGHFRSLANAMPIMVWAATPTGATDFYNDRWYEFTGLSPDAIGSPAWEERFHPDDRDRAWAAYLDSAAAGAAFEIEYRLMHASGGYRWVRSSALPMYDDAGRLIRWLGTCYDIQELIDCRRDKDSAVGDLKSERDHLESILDSVPDGMIVIDEDGAIQSFSPAAELQFGWTATEVIGRNITVLMPPSYRAEHERALDLARAAGKARPLPVRRVLAGERRDGSTFPLELSVGESRSGGQRFFTGFVRDLSEHQAAEQRVSDIQTELAHVSRLSAMGEMASGLAHELNQPLTAAASYVQGALLMLDRTPRDESVMREALTSAGDQVIRAGEIIRRLRDLVTKSRAEQQVEDLSRLLEEATALAMLGAKDQGVRLTYNVNHKVRHVMADRVQIQQVILNLMRNAIEAMADTSRRELVVRAADIAGDLVEVSIADTGSGISSKVADRLFQPFISTKLDGMGVGLSISRTIIEAHGGRIFVDQNPGGGTIFRFTLKAVAGARGDGETI